MKNISILGSTGSIGQQTLDIVRKFPGKFRIISLAANKNIGLLKEQIGEFSPKAVAVMDSEAADSINVDIPVLKGMDGFIEASTMPETDMLVTAVTGSVGLKPTLAAINAKKDIALANKETLVAAGYLVMEQVKKHDVNLMPVDSEHSALFQCMHGENRKDVEKVIITCSGGPFRNFTIKQLQCVTLRQALAHPTWKMGGKITVDSATLMNKGFEVLEAKWMYDLLLEQIEVVIHPESTIHSMVQYKDGNIIAQLATPDMRVPIQYALSYPDRHPNKFPRINFYETRHLSFDRPDIGAFPCLSYAYEAGIKGGTLASAMNAANEIAVDLFLKNKCKFTQIPQTIKKVMQSHNITKEPDIDDILDADIWARRQASKLLGELKSELPPLS